MSSVINMAPLSGKRPEHAGKPTVKIGLSLLLATSLLVGCAGYSKDHVIVGSVPDDYRTRHPIIVSDNEVHEDLALSSNMRKLSMRHRNVVRDFAMRFKESGAKTVRLMVPVGSHNEMAARSVTQQIIEEFAEIGIHRSRIVKNAYQASGHGDSATLRMAFSAMTAQVADECGQWDENLIHTPENKNYGNFGCATQSNLATMVANPNDLLGPRGESEIDATRRDTVIKDWRENGTVELPDLISANE